MQEEPGRLKIKRVAVKEGVDDEVAQQTRSSTGVWPVCFRTTLVKRQPTMPGNEEINHTHTPRVIYLQTSFQNGLLLQMKSSENPAEKMQGGAAAAQHEL